MELVYIILKKKELIRLIVQGLLLLMLTLDLEITILPQEKI